MDNYISQEDITHLSPAKQFNEFGSDEDPDDYVSSDEDDFFKKPAEDDAGGHIDEEPSSGNNDETPGSRFNNEGQEHSSLSDTDPIIEPKLGMIFNGRDEADALWKLYGLRIGFATTRKSFYRFSGSPYSCVFICSRGRLDEKSQTKEDPQNETKQPLRGYGRKKQGDHCTNCPARFLVRDFMFTDVWKIVSVELEHNHELDPESARLFTCHRQLPQFVKTLLKINDDAGVPQKQSIKSIVAQCGGPENCSYIVKDAYNEVHAIRALKLKGGDGNALMQYFIKRKAECPEFFYECQHDQAGRLSKIFWATARCRAAYRFFGDVVTFDTTYLTNKYDMPFGPFVGVNQHGQSILLGCCLLPDETTDTFVWVMKTWLECMGGQAPRGIITDQCAAMASAIQQVFPNTSHRLCLWHIMQKIPRKVGQGIGRKSRIARIKNVVYNSTSVSEFEEEWQLIIDEFPLAGLRRDWFTFMFQIREKWVPIYLNHNFWAGMSTTQRSESINAFFKSFINSSTRIYNFALQYEGALMARWETERLEDFRNFKKTPVLLSTHPFEHQVAAYYSNRLFYVFQEEIKQLMNIYCEVVSVQDQITTFMVSDSTPIIPYTEPARNHNTSIRSRIELYMNTIPCSTAVRAIYGNLGGVVCRHALCVYRQIGNPLLPACYMLPRWSANRERTKFLRSLVMPDDVIMRELYNATYSRSSEKLVSMVNMCTRSREIADMLDSGLDNLLEQIKGKYDEIAGEESDDGTPELTESDIDPLCAVRVGRPRSLRSKDPAHGKRQRAAGVTKQSGTAQTKRQRVAPMTPRKVPARRNKATTILESAAHNEGARGGDFTGESHVSNVDLLRGFDEASAARN